MATPLKISISGVRGIVGEGLDATAASRWAAAFGARLPAGPVVVGRDSRPSGPMLLRAVTAALTGAGHDVHDLGVASTPTTELAVARSEAVGGVIITASHNPQQWNALKFLDGRGLFLEREAVAELQRLHDEGPPAVGWDRIGSVRGIADAEARHVEAVLALPWLDRERLRARGLRVVVDAVEGAGGRLLPRLLDALGVACVPLHCGLSGIFPHDPEPTPAHLEELCRVVRREGADLGLAVDPDVDRLALVAEGGRPLSEELTLVLAADFLLARQPGPVVVNLSTTGLIEKVAARHGAPVRRAPVGEANVVAEMLRGGAVLGGEGNGGVILPALHAGRDALVGTAAVLQLLAESGRSLGELAAALPPAAMVKLKLPEDALPDGPGLASVLAGLGRGTLDERDGLRWSGEAGWVHVRRSNTEPAVRVIAEAEDEAAARRLIERVTGRPAG